MDLNKYLFYFIKDKSIACENGISKRHHDCIEEVMKQEDIYVSDNRVETMIKQMLEKGYIAFMMFGATYLFLPDNLNDKQVDLLNSADKKNIIKIKGYSKEKLPYGEFIDYDIENQIHGISKQTVEEILENQIKIKNRSK